MFASRDRDESRQTVRFIFAVALPVFEALCLRTNYVESNDVRPARRGLRALRLTLSDSCKEDEQSIISVEPAEFAASGRQFGERLFLDGEIGVQVFVGSFGALVAQPQSADGDVHARLQQRHRSAVAQGVRRDALLAQAGTPPARPLDGLVKQQMPLAMVTNGGKPLIRLHGWGMVTQGSRECWLNEDGVSNAAKIASALGRHIRSRLPADDRYSVRTGAAKRIHCVPPRWPAWRRRW